MRSSKLAAMAVLAVLILVAACGGSAGSPTSAPAATTAGGGATTAPAATTAGQPTAAGGGPTTGPGVGVDPCAVLTQADLKTATGTDYGAGVLAYGQCTWLAGTDTVNTGKGQVVVAFNTAQSLADVKSSYAGGVDSTVGGHNAVWNPTQGIQTLWVDLGTFLLTISIDPVPSDGQAIAQHLGELAVAKM